MPHVTFIHGIANKPARDKLIDTWIRALAHDGGLDLGAEGVTSTLVYWADVMYESPLDDEPAYESSELSESLDLALRQHDPALEMSWLDAVEGEEAAWVESMATKFNYNALVDEQVAPPESEIGPQFERIPLPGWLKRRMMKTFLRDVHHYLFNIEMVPRADARYPVQDEIRSRMITALREGASKPGPHVVVSHSMGTVIVYDCLKRAPDCPRVDGLITIGSPLGIDEIQDQLKPEWSRLDGFPGERLTGGWVNVYDHLDPVAGFDPNLANDYLRSGLPAITDISEPNWGRWRHDITKYLSGKKLRAKLAEFLGL